MMKIVLLVFVILSCIVINGQSSYTITSQDSLVTAENFISFDEGIDSVVVTNKNSLKIRGCIKSFFQKLG